MFKYFVNSQKFLILMTLFVISGCSDNKSPSQGSATFNLQWERPGASVGKSVSATLPDICSEYGIQTIKAAFVDPSGVIKATGNFACSDHQGTVIGIPPAENYTVKFEGVLTADLVGWRSEKTGVSITANVVNQIGAITMIYVGSDTTPPTVASSTPANNATEVSTSNPLNIVFSEAMAPSTINTSTVTLSKGGEAVAGTVSYVAATKTATFTPTAPLANITTYVLTVGTGVKDIAYNTLAEPYTVSFTTDYYSISGKITISSVLALKDVSLTRSGSATPVITAVDGKYSFTGVTNGTYTLTPTKAGYDFTPASIDATVNDANANGKDFTATANTPPAAPTDLTITGFSSNQISLIWTDNANNEDKYMIERSLASGGVITTIEVPANATNTINYTDSALSASTPYYYRVRATNSLGYTDSNEVSVKTADGITPDLVPVGTLFSIGKDEVLQGDWETIMGSKPPSLTLSSSLPVENVSWKDVDNFIKALNAGGSSTGITTYRLPTMAEWQYAAQNGQNISNMNGSVSEWVSDSPRENYRYLCGWDSVKNEIACTSYLDTSHSGLVGFRLATSSL